MREAVQRGGALEFQPDQYFLLYPVAGGRLDPGALTRRARPMSPLPSSVGPAEPQVPGQAPPLEKGRPALAGPTGPPGGARGARCGSCIASCRGGTVCWLAARMVPDLAAMRRLALWLMAAGASVLVLGLAGGWWVATRAIRPIEGISATAVKIAGGDLSQRINAADTDSELGRLAGVLNSTFARLEAAFTQQARFTSDASHELRTPVSVILSQTQTALSRERPPPNIAKLWKPASGPPGA